MAAWLNKQAGRVFYELAVQAVCVFIVAYSVVRRPRALLVFLLGVVAGCWIRVIAG